LYNNGRTDRASLQRVTRPSWLHVSLYYNGRPDRASLHRATRPSWLHVSLYYNGRTTVRPYSRYTSCGTTKGYTSQRAIRDMSPCGHRVVRPQGDILY
ncbi:hypothetical protein, partial [Porphyromonas uenonis]|uniref:hypothetical protein n=1 Tax=Porphyromonas uenonis TaxID=281920 RepID=UPI0026EB4A88